MNLTVDVYELKNSVSFVCANAHPKGIVPGTRGIRLTAKDESLTMAATDMAAWVKQSIPANVKTEGGVFVDAKDLNGVIASLTGDGDVKLSFKKRLSITKGKQRRTLPPMDGADFPEEPQVEFEINWDQSAQGFIHQAKQVAFATLPNDDFSRPILTGINMDMSNCLIVGGDGKRLGIYKTDDTVETDLNPTFPIRFVQEIERSGMGGETSISVSNTWIRALSEDQLSVIWVKSIVGLYPIEATKLAKELTKASGLILRMGKSELVQSLNLACMFAQRAKSSSEDGVLHIVSNSGKIWLEMNVPNVGELRDIIPGESDGDMTLLLEPKFLLEAVNHVDADEVYLKKVEGQSIIVITDPNRPGWAVIQAEMVQPRQDENTEGEF